MAPRHTLLEAGSGRPAGTSPAVLERDVGDVVKFEEISTEPIQRQARLLTSKQEKAEAHKTISRMYT